MYASSSASGSRSWTPSWYESFPAKLDALAAVPFVFDFLTRTGRVDATRLQAEYPEFMKRYGAEWAAHAGDRSGGADEVPT